jgi:hypothetical protein
MEMLTSLFMIASAALIAWKAPELQRWLTRTTKHPMFDAPVFLWWF